jgi:hypothetical protein
MGSVMTRANLRSMLAVAILGCPPLHAADYVDLRSVAPIRGDPSAGAIQG